FSIPLGTSYRKGFRKPACTMGQAPYSWPGASGRPRSGSGRGQIVSREKKQGAARTAFPQYACGRSCKILWREYSPSGGPGEAPSKDSAKTAREGRQEKCAHVCERRRPGSQEDARGIRQHGKN